MWSNLAIEIIAAKDLILRKIDLEFLFYFAQRSEIINTLLIDFKYFIK